MVVLAIVVYLVFVFLLLIFGSKKHGIKRPIIKNKKFKFNFSKNNFKIFYCKNDFEKQILKRFSLTKKYIFESDKQFLEKTSCLKNIGVDYFKKIYKIEAYKNFCYKKIFEEICFLNHIKNLGENFYLFVFVDKPKNLEIFEGFFRQKNFDIDYKIFDCLSVSYQLLSSINFFNINKDFKTKKSVISHNRNFKTTVVAHNKVVKGFKSVINKNYSKSNIFLKIDDEVTNFDNLVFEDLCLKKEAKIKNCQVNFSKTYSKSLDCEVAKFDIKNFDIRPKDIKLFWTFKIEKSSHFFVKNKTKDKVFFEDKTNTKKYMFFGVKNCEIFDDKVVFSLSVNVDKFGFKTVEVFRFFDTKIFANFNKNSLPLKLNFDLANKELKGLKRLKFLSTNTQLNKLLNDFLPNKIIKNKLENIEDFNADFDNFFSLNFSHKFVNKNFAKIGLKNFYLAKKNLYEIFVSLVYFYFGFFVSQNGLILFSEDKSFVLDDFCVIFRDKNKNLIITEKKQNLKNEIKVNGIVYSNLKSLNYLTFLGDKDAKIELNF